MSIVAAVDLGTTTARAGLFDSGERIGSAKRKLATAHPFPGAVEQDPAELVSVVVELLTVVLAETGVDAGAVTGLGVANQRSTVVAWSADSGQPLRPAIGWQDTRTAARVAEFVAQGIPLTTSASCSKLGWLMTHDATVAAASAAGTLRLGTVDSWLTYALSGGTVHVTDPSNAGATGVYDLRSGDWSGGALDLFEIPREPLATVVASEGVVGTTAGHLLGAEIPLAARIGDQQSACVAHGLGEGGAKLTLGTSAMLDVGTGETPAEAPTGTYALPLARRPTGDGHADEFMVEGSVQAAGAAVEWLVRMGLLETVEQLDETVARGRPGPVVVPVLAGLGSPWQDPTARGIIAGLGLDTTPADVVGATVDGIADRVADIAAVLDITGPLPVDGGLSRSAAMLQALADATGSPIRPARDPETTLRGAAILAATATGADAPPSATYHDDVLPRTTAEDRAARRAHWRRWLDTAKTTGNEGKE